MSLAGELEPDEPPVLPSGTHVAPGYVVLELLRRGHDYDTYDAWSERRHARCVVKVLRADRIRSRSARRRLLLEGRLLRTLTHPHLVRAYDVLVQPSPVLVLETLNGATLSYLLDDGRRRLATPDLAFLGAHLCSAMFYLHAQGYLHLDLKPGNVISDAGRAKVLDLSLAQPPGPCSAGVGTRSYLAPEQARGEILGPAADVWGIGITVYEAATATSPFDTSSGRGYEQLQSRAPSVRGLRRLPRSMAQALDACLEPAPADRPTLLELSGVFTAVTGDDEPVASRGGYEPAGEPPATTRPSMGEQRSPMS